jgi:hypothetical protein
MSFDLVPSGIGRPSRGVRYSRNSTPGPAFARIPGDLEVRAKNLIQMFLFPSKIFALARFAHPEQIAVKLQARRGVRDANRGAVDAEEKLFVRLLPARVAFSRRERNQFEIISVRIAKIKCLDPGSRGNRSGQRLRGRRDELHLERAQFCKDRIMSRTTIATC